MCQTSGQHWALAAETDDVREYVIYKKQVTDVIAETGEL